MQEKGCSMKPLTPLSMTRSLMFTQGKDSVLITHAQVLCASSLEPAEVWLLEKGFLHSLQSLCIRWKQSELAYFSSFSTS